MEYCITILLRQFNPDDRLKVRQTVETAWGKTDVDRDLFEWADEITLRRVGPIGHLLSYVPVSRRDGPWVWLSISGRGVHEFQNRGPVDDGEEDPREHDLIWLVKYVLSMSREWVVFYERDCDRVRDVVEQRVDELVDAMVAARNPMSDCGGFCSVARLAEESRGA